MSFCVAARSRPWAARRRSSRATSSSTTTPTAPARTRRTRPSSCRCSCRRRARRLRGDQGALARHRRQGAVLHRHGRRLPGGHDLPRASSCTARGELVDGHLPHRDRQLAGAEDGRRRHQRQVVGVRTGAAALVRVVERLRPRALPTSAVAADVRPRRGASSARGSSGCPTGATSAAARWTRTASSDDPVPFEVAVEIDGSTACASTSRMRPTQQAGPINCPLPSTVSASRIAIAMLAGGGEAPNEGHFRPIEVVDPAGHAVPPAAPAPCFLYGWTGDQAIEAIYQARRPGACRRPCPPAAALQSPGARAHLGRRQSAAVVDEDRRLRHHRQPQNRAAASLPRVSLPVRRRVWANRPIELNMRNEQLLGRHLHAEDRGRHLLPERGVLRDVDRRAWSYPSTGGPQ